VTAKSGCIALTVAIWSFLIAAGFVIFAWLHQPEATAFEKVTSWSVYGFSVVVGLLGTIDAWRGEGRGQ